MPLTSPPSHETVVCQAPCAVSPHAVPRKLSGYKSHDEVYTDASQVSVT